MSTVQEQIRALAPWHLNIDVVPGVTTAIASDSPADPDFGPVSFIDARPPFRNLMAQIYPDGLQGRSFLDCACNSGAYLFWAKELGAGRCFGFDAREHWINQARFLMQHRPETGISVEVSDLYDVPRLGLEPFAVTQFKGIFYHLPDPVSGLRIAADLTTEVIIVDSATVQGPADGLIARHESTTQVMSGIHGLNWMPTGPAVLGSILRWLGFSEWRCTYWRGGERYGRVQVVASREPGRLARLPNVSAVETVVNDIAGRDSPG